jgi:hypothetical protein
MSLCRDNENMSKIDNKQMSEIMFCRFVRVVSAIFLIS